MCKYEPNTLKIYILREPIIERIRGHRSTPLKSGLALTLNLSVTSIHRLLRENVPNGFLTTMAAVEVIGNALNLSPEQIIVAKPLL